MRRSAVALALLFLFGASPGIANDMPPLVRVIGQYSKVFMFVDDRILQVRGLTEHCEQETRDWANTVETEAMARASVPPGELADFGRRYDIGSIAGRRYYSIIRMSGTDIDGKYKAFDIDTLLWDAKTDSRVSPAVFLTEAADRGPTMHALFELVKAGLAEKLAHSAGAVVVREPEPSLSGIGPISLAGSTIPGKSAGLNFHYALFVPGRFAPKQVVVFVPWRKFSRYLSAQGRAIFAGEWKEREI
ncbi:MAG: hypothetical protein HY852_11960 [Bradyrhizobium sp.]|uniref:hypothetical protein n=1 Tax=Bradyrhizobium sp. TaxID=376 RepID=UPI0025BB29F5|nr:hypothetical protein [Bradyrhizobium sp.]MBI5262518.1 hypothetical protein [Bradyrhizobium sp.]